jgi:hypothetical protein
MPGAVPGAYGAWVTSPPPSGAAPHGMERLTPGQLRALLQMVRDAAGEDEAPDLEELSRMWLVTMPEAGGSLFLNELHARARLIHSPSGLYFLTPEGRELVGVAFGIRQLVIPSPIDLHEDLNELLAAHESGAMPLGRSDKWRLQRILRQARRASSSPNRWSSFVLRNDVAREHARIWGVWLATGQRLAVAVDPELPESEQVETPIADDDPFWDHNDYTRFAIGVIRDATDA